MSDTLPQEWPADTARGPVPAKTVREQLTCVVNSPAFVSSPRLIRFLTHIVSRTIDGDSDSLKEFSIAMEVFDRTADYDPNIDAIVRVEARRLRSKLKWYYEEGPGRSDPVLIGLRPGSYVPIFRWLESKPEKDWQDQRAAVEVGRASVAVLPFVNMSPEPEQDYFCDGVSEEIINTLTRVPGLNVIARTSAFQFKGVAVDIREVGQRLGADLIIEGSVRKAGSQLRITAQAIHSESGHHLWSETFRRELKDIFAVQEGIAESVARLLRLHMPKVPVHSSQRRVEPYTRHLQARFLIHQQSPEALRTAVQQLRELIQLYPDYAPAYSGLAAANGLLCLFGEVMGRDLYPEVKANAERGYQLEPDSGETCAVLGGLRAWFEYRWEEANRLYERALKAQPGHAGALMFSAMTLLCQGNIEAAEAGLRRSNELDPLSASDCARMGYVYYVRGDCDAAAEQLNKSLELDRNYPEARFYEGLLRFRQEDYAGVIQSLSDSEFPLHAGLVAAAHARKGSGVRARKCLEAISRIAEKQYVTPLAYALAATGMDHRDLAFKRLAEAIEHKTTFVNMLGIEPFFEPLRKDRLFFSVLKTLNLSH
jgi:adenylate cyclase